MRIKQKELEPGKMYLNHNKEKVRLRFIEKDKFGILAVVKHLKSGMLKVQTQNELKHYKEYSSGDKTPDDSSFEIEDVVLEDIDSGPNRMYKIVGYNKENNEYKLAQLEEDITENISADKLQNGNYKKLGG